MNNKVDIKEVNFSVDIIKYLPKEYSWKAEKLIQEKFEVNEISKLYNRSYIYQVKLALERIVKNPDLEPRPSLNIEVVNILKEIAQENYLELKNLGLL